MDFEKIYVKALDLRPVSSAEGLALYRNAPLDELIFIGNMLRQIHNPGKNAGWIIDRNVNITNVCFSQCLFCNFCRKKNSPDAYITTVADYIKKIDEMIALGGDQLLLQGGMNPDLGLNFILIFSKPLRDFTINQASCSGAT
jgi:cyclic dehypoxanthinyl futalosine synthase